MSSTERMRLRSPFAAVQRRRPGGGLLDALAAIAVLAAVTAIAAPAYRGLDARDLAQETTAIVGLLREARARAIATGGATTATIDLARNQVETRLGADTARAPAHRTFALGRDRTLAARTAALGVGPTRAGALERGGTTPAPALVIRFFPNGSSTGGEVLIMSPNDARRLRIDWATGAIDNDRIAPRALSGDAADVADRDARGHR